MVKCITGTPDALGNYWENPAYRPIVDTSLVLWLTSDFGNSGTWTDLTRKDNHGTIYGATRTPLHPLGIFGSALDFNGIETYIDCGNDASLNNYTHITNEFWIKMNAPKNYLSMMSRESAYYIRHGYGFMTWRMWGLTEGAISTSYYYPYNWTHYAFTWDGTALRVYLNGVLDNETPATGTITNNANNLWISHFSDAWDGTIGEVKIYNRALSGTEIIHNYTHSPIYYIQKGLI